MIEQDSIDQLKARANIYDIVSQYVELRRSGANYTACCPFHDEKTPSFFVSPSRNRFNCFGCGEGGNALDFVMKIENLQFAEAVEKLAYMCNFTLTYTDKQITFDYSAALAKIAQFYQSKMNAEIIDYLKKRGIEQSSIEKFALGFSGTGNELLAFLTQNKMPLDKLLEIGVIGQNDGRYYAKFFSRIMFPISSPSGKIVGFGGRIMGGEKTAKYINSQQSKIFNKSRLLYGYNLAKDAIFKEKRIIVTEGYIDVVMLHQAGFCNAVATLGTALTENHLPLLSRGEVEILLCYDGDNAGINAAFKASLLLANKSGGVIIFEGGKDPADMVSEGRIAEILELFKRPIPFIKFVIQTIANRFDLSNPLQKESALREISKFMQTLSPILQDEYRDFAANAIAVAPHLLGVKSEVILQMPRQRAISAEDILLKSILNDNSLLDFALEYVDADIFAKKGAFCALKQGDFEHKDLLAIAIDESIKTLGYADFREQMRFFIMSAYEKALRQVKNAAVADRIALSIEINKKINLLKNGTLVRYEKCF